MVVAAYGVHEDAHVYEDTPEPLEMKEAVGKYREKHEGRLSAYLGNGLDLLL
jgi:hypothetical protein